MKYAELYIHSFIGAWFVVEGLYVFGRDSVVLLVLGGSFIAAAQYRYIKIKKEETGE